MRGAGAIQSLSRGLYQLNEAAGTDAIDFVTSRRLAILRAVTGGETISIREVARRVDRDVKAVHADVRALVNAGLVEDTGSGVRFGYDAVRVEFTLQAA